MGCKHVRELADEVAMLMAERFGASPREARSGSALEAALFFHGTALPGKLRRQGQRLAKAERRCIASGVASDADTRRAVRAHEALTRYLRRHVRAPRVMGRTARLVATCILGLMLLAAAALWLKLSRGQF